MSFKDFNLDEILLDNISKAGYEVPTEIQQIAIPKLIEGLDVCGSSFTGSGKTAAFLLPCIQRIISTEKKGTGARVLVLVPTRELAIQIADQAIKYSKNVKKMKVISIYGGVSYFHQKKDLSSKYEILIATPGRLIDYMRSGKIRFDRLETLILDEADRMLDMGFIDDIEMIAENLPKDRQTVLFTATMPKTILNLTKSLMRNPISIAAKASAIPTTITHQCYFTDNLSKKHEFLEEYLQKNEIDQAIIFTSTKSYANTLQEMLEEKNIFAKALHGDISQDKRIKILKRFEAKKIKFLIATDLAARGLNIPNVSHVFNFDFPNNIEDYIHRTGRTGRAGKKGSAISFIGNNETSFVHKLKEKKIEIEFLNQQNKSFKEKTHSKPFKRNNFRKKKIWR